MIENRGKNIHIGAVTGAVGLKGEIRIFHTAADPELLQEYESIIIGGKKYDIDNIRYKKKIPILKLAQVNDRNSAEELLKEDVFVESEKLVDLPDNNYYVKDLVGIEIIDVDSEEIIGTLVNVITNTAQDVYEVRTRDGMNLMIPAVNEFIINVDLNKKTMKVKLPEGLDDIKY